MRLEDIVTKPPSTWTLIAGDLRTIELGSGIFYDGSEAVRYPTPFADQATFSNKPPAPYSDTQYQAQYFENRVDLQHAFSGNISATFLSVLNTSLEVNAESSHQKVEIFFVITFLQIERISRISDDIKFTLKTEAAEMLQASSITSYRQQYGEAYVHSIDYGRSSTLIIRLELASESEKIELLGKAGVQGGPAGGGISLSAKFLTALENQTAQVFFKRNAMSALPFKEMTDALSVVHKIQNAFQAINHKAPTDLAEQHETAPPQPAEEDPPVVPIAFATKYYNIAVPLIDSQRGLMDNVGRFHALQLTLMTNAKRLRENIRQRLEDFKSSAAPSQSHYWHKQLMMYQNFIASPDLRMKTVLDYVALEFAVTRWLINIADNPNAPQMLRHYLETLAYLNAKFQDIYEKLQGDLLQQNTSDTEVCLIPLSSVNSDVILAQSHSTSDDPKLFFPLASDSPLMRGRTVVETQIRTTKQRKDAQIAHNNWYKLQILTDLSNLLRMIDDLLYARQHPRVAEQAGLSVRDHRRMLLSCLVYCEGRLELFAKNLYRISDQQTKQATKILELFITLAPALATGHHDLSVLIEQLPAFADLYQNVRQLIETTPTPIEELLNTLKNALSRFKNELYPYTKATWILPKPPNETSPNADPLSPTHINPQTDDAELQIQTSASSICNILYEDCAELTDKIEAAIQDISSLLDEKPASQRTMLATAIRNFQALLEDSLARLRGLTSVSASDTDRLTDIKRLLQVVIDTTTTTYKDIRREHYKHLSGSFDNLLSALDTHLDSIPAENGHSLSFRAQPGSLASILGNRRANSPHLRAASIDPAAAAVPAEDPSALLAPPPGRRVQTSFPPELPGTVPTSFSPAALRRRPESAPLARRTMPPHTPLAGGIDGSTLDSETLTTVSNKVTLPNAAKAIALRPVPPALKLKQFQENFSCCGRWKRTKHALVADELHTSDSFILSLPQTKFYLKPAKSAHQANMKHPANHPQEVGRREKMLFGEYSVGFFASDTLTLPAAPQANSIEENLQEVLAAIDEQNQM